MYQIFSLRGYSGGIIEGMKIKNLDFRIFLYMAVSIIILVGVIVF